MIICELIRKLKWMKDIKKSQVKLTFAFHTFVINFITNVKTTTKAR